MTYEFFPIRLMHLVLHCLINELRIRRFLCERCGQHSQSLQIENLRDVQKICQQNRHSKSMRTTSFRL